MESHIQPPVVPTEKKNPLRNNKIYKILIWENVIHSLIAFKIVNTFFYINVVWGHSFINLFIKSLLGYITYTTVWRFLKNKIVEDEDDHYNYDLISEDTLKELYVVIYVGVNKAI